MQPLTARAFFIACAFIASGVAHAAQGGGVAVKKAWMPAAVAGQPSAPVYLDIRSDHFMRLTALRSPIAASVVIVDPDATDDRRTKTNLPVEARKTIHFTQSKPHIELRNVNRTVEKGDKVLLMLTFSDYRETSIPIEVSVEVRAAPVAKKTSR